MARDGLKLEGSVVVRKNGEVIHKGKNLIVTAGKGLAADLLGGDSTAALSHIAIGTSNTAAAAGQTALQGSELAREAAVVTVTGAEVELVATFAAGTGTGTIEEVGIFNDATTGTMFARYLTGTITKGASDSIQITWKVTVT